MQSIRSSRRVGPDGQVVFDLVTEVTQTRKVRGRSSDRGFDLLGGATVVIGPDGHVRYVVSKSVLNEERVKRQRAFLSPDRGRQLWKSRFGQLAPVGRPFKALHPRTRRSSPPETSG